MSELLGTKFNPAGFDAMRAAARAAKAYHALNPYPDYSAMTKDWKTEERGPYPRCLPFVRHIVNKGARWLFGKPISFRVTESDPISELVNKAWTDNDMTRRSYAMGVTGALSGGVAIKWSYSSDSDVKIQVLDPAEHTRFYFDPMDQSRLLMARVQFPYFDAASNVWYWYREDWTDEELWVYEPVAMSTLGINSTPTDPYVYAANADIFDQWKVKSTERNPFGVIPLWYCRNSETGREVGEGDLWACYHVIDLVNFTYDLGHKNNQKAIDPKIAYIDLAAPAEDATGTDGPMGAQTLVTTEGSETQGKIQQLSPDTALRPHLREFAEDLKKMVYDLAGSVEVNADEITNKGNLTTAVLTQLYAPLIEATEGKRTCYGEDGLCVFFERMSLGLTNANVPGWQPAEDVQIQWPGYWEVPEQEKNLLVQRQASMIENSFTTHERAVREIAQRTGVVDVDTLLVETRKLRAEQEKRERAEQGAYAKARAGVTP